MFHVVLHNPVIPPNTGNVIRLAANIGFDLHLIEPLGFDLEEKQLRRAGLDYHDLSQVTRYSDYQSFLEAVAPKRLFAITTSGTNNYSSTNFEKGDTFVFGSETSGLPEHVMNTFSEQQKLRIPMQANNRSLNLSNSVAIISYEAWRQNSFSGAV